ncbi:MAG: ABC transporter permease [Bacteroidia bacterium]|nr:ABC transporter permease [Bacteroidia bacterium]
MNKIGWPAWVLLVYMGLVVLTPLLANEKKLIRICEGKWSFPFLASAREYAEPEVCKDGELGLAAPVPYSPGSSDTMNMQFCSPFEKQLFSRNGKVVDMPMRYRHWLGTDMQGSDLLADLLYGSRISLFVSVLAALVSWLLGAVLGFLAAWFGPGSRKVSLKIILPLLLGGLLLWHVLNNFYNESAFYTAILFAVLLTVLAFIVSLNFIHWRWVSGSISIPLDTAFLRIAELFSAIPRVVLVLALSAVFEPSIWSVVVVLSLSGWVDMGRLIRAEVSGLKERSYIEAARLSGYRGFRLFTKQMLPNIWPSSLVILLYSVAGNMAIEASLSFMGFGLPPQIKTIGSIVADAKIYYEAWWLVVFPGLWLSLLIFSLFEFSRRYRRLAPD